jgi:hypothetical protein
MLDSCCAPRLGLGSVNPNLIQNSLQEDECEEQLNGNTGTQKLAWVKGRETMDISKHVPKEIGTHCRR